MGTVRGNRQVIPLEYVTVSRWNEEERRRLEGLIKKEQRNKEREREKKHVSAGREEGTVHTNGEKMGAVEGGKERKKDRGTPWGAEKPPKKQTLR